MKDIRINASEVSILDWHPTPYSWLGMLSSNTIYYLSIENINGRAVLISAVI